MQRGMNGRPWRREEGLRGLAGGWLAGEMGTNRARPETLRRRNQTAARRGVWLRPAGFAAALTKENRRRCAIVESAPR
jgi:hypothetical protein